MRCPYCLDSLTAVVDARWDSRHQTIRRHRRCPKCQYHWATLEIDYDQVRHLDSVSRRRSKGPGFPQDRRRGVQGRDIASDNKMQHRGSGESSEVDHQIDDSFDNQEREDDIDDNSRPPLVAKD
jgi:hypothetical protein